MKVLLKTRKELQAAGRWDIDFHLPPERIKAFPCHLLKRVDEVGFIARDKRDPAKDPDSVFRYIDISSVDVTIGRIANPQDVEGSEAPSRARKVVRAFDILVSTCRPTRGAIAVVPLGLHNQIASTGFSVIRANENVNPFYLHYALRLPSTLEQFRKWSTGSSYPAILDSDVRKTLIPVPDVSIQDTIAAKVVMALKEREMILSSANKKWMHTLDQITGELCGKLIESFTETGEKDNVSDIHSLAHVMGELQTLCPLTTDNQSDEQVLDEVCLPGFEMSLAR